MPKKPDQIDYRNSAKQHVTAAKELLEKGDPASVRYACLEIRMAIEALVYQSLLKYLEDVPNRVMEKWTPKQVLSELLEVDPYADKSPTIRITNADAGGAHEKPFELVGTERRFTIGWANKAHNALSNALHEPTISQHETSASSIEAFHDKAGLYLLELESILSSQFFNIDIRSTIRFQCDCGYEVTRRETALEANPEVACAACGEIYQFAKVGDELRFRSWKVGYHCPSCQKETSVNKKEVFEGSRWECPHCHAASVISFRPILVPHQDAA
jgi:DNA-directed RNA polymerase subunit RPC12/RpoP